jgi:hypothetical protein
MARNPKRRQATADDGEAWFDPWLVADNTLDPVAAEVAEIIATNRKLGGGNKVQSHRLPVFNATVSAVVANLADACASTDTGRIAVHLPTAGAKGLGRYGCSMVPVRMLKKVLTASDDNGFLKYRKGRRGVAATIQPTIAFRDHLARHRAFVGDVVRRGGEELIVLSKRTKHDIEKSDGSKEFRDQSKRVPYDDDEAIIAMRAEVAAINDYLSTKAALAFEDDGEEPRVNVRRRRLVRHFNLLPDDGDTASFNKGGRLFGAFWSNLDRTRRRASLRIDGEPIAEVDFNAMFTRLAYASSGKVLGDDDPYTPLTEQLGEERSVIKQAVNAFFFKHGMMRNWPKEIADGWNHKPKVRDVWEGVIQHLPDLEPFLGTTAGFHFMRTESDILVASMMKLMKQRITALPLHDAVLVAESKAEDVREVLEATALELTGVRLPANIKQGLG